MKITRVSALSTVFSALAVVLALSACGPGSSASGASVSDSAAATPQPTTPVSRTPPSTTEPVTAGMKTLPRSCPPDSLLDHDLGLAVVSTGGDDTDVSACVYTGVKTIVSINFALTPGLTAAQAQTKTRAQGTTAAFKVLPDVGDAAFYDTPKANGKTGSYIAVLSGSVSFHIVVTSVVPATKMAKAAQNIIKGS